MQENTQHPIIPAPSYKPHSLTRNKNTMDKGYDALFLIQKLKLASVNTFLIYKQQKQHKRTTRGQQWWGRGTGDGGRGEEIINKTRSIEKQVCS